MLSIAKHLKTPKHRQFYQQASSATRAKMTGSALIKALGLKLLREGVRVGIVKTPGSEVSFEDPVLSHTFEPGDDRDYLSGDEIQFFQQNGYVGPFPLLDAEEARRLHRVIRNKIMTEPVVYGRYHDLTERKRQGLLRRRGIEESVVERGWYRHLNIPEMFDVMTDGKIAKRIASLLGEHVMMWRSQCFEVAPGSKGTGLHQTADFGMDGTQPTLLPERPGTSHDSLIQLTAWVALTDATPDNGCLVFIPGTHRTDFFVRSFTRRNLIVKLSQMPLATILDCLATLEVATRFDRQVAHFEMSTWFYENIFRPEHPQLFANIRPVPMRAGEFVIFTSKMVHGSVPNRTEDSARFALGGRFTTADVRVMPGRDSFTDVLHFLPDKVTVPISKIGVTPVHGSAIGNNHLAVPERRPSVVREPFYQKRRARVA